MVAAADDDNENNDEKICLEYEYVLYKEKNYTIPVTCVL